MADSEQFDDVETQRRYYAETAQRYDEMHVAFDESDPHYLALCLMLGTLDFLHAQSVLDIGSGTGRALNYINTHRPSVKAIGIEPVRELRLIGHANGIPPDQLMDGDALNLSFGDATFDIVCEFGVLHHVRNPAAVVAEMLRVARKGIFISDSNNFGQGSLISRAVKQTINAIGLWKHANYIKTRGKGYMLSKEEGVAYSYSVFNNYKLIKEACESVHILNTEGGRFDLYRTAGHVALLGVKRQAQGAL